MNRNEFKLWAEDCAVRFPETAAHINSLSDATRELWFEEIFKPHELRDAMALNRRLFETGEGLRKFDRDQLPSLLSKQLRDIRYERENREQEIRARQRMATHGAMKTVITDPVMGPAYREVCAKIREFKEGAQGQMPPREMIQRWTEQAFAKHDKTDEYQARRAEQNSLNAALQAAD